MSKPKLIKIKGAVWKVYFLTPTAYLKKFKDEGPAHVAGESRSFYFVKNEINLGIVRHELLHAIIYESHIESAELEAKQIEELCCSVIQYNWHDIAEMAEEIIDASSKK